MFEIENHIRVRYADTDQMGYVYYGKYAEFFEVGRTEMFRKLGLRYANMEKEQNVMLPVLNLNIKYIRPAFYDELLTLTTTIEKFPTSKITFSYKVFNSRKELITTGSTDLVFVDTVTRRPVRCPENISEMLKKYI